MHNLNKFPAPQEQQGIPEKVGDEVKEDKVVDASGFRAPHLGITRRTGHTAPARQPAAKATADKPVTEKAAQQKIAAPTSDDELKRFFKYAKNNATLAQLLEIASGLQELSASKKVDMFMAIARCKDASTTDLVKFAKEADIAHIRVVDNTIAAARERNLHVKEGTTRAAILAAGQFQRPEFVVKTEGKTTNIGNPNPKGLSGSKQENRSNPKKAESRKK